MRVIGLTGGIASGKSTAARILAELGARVVDADADRPRRGRARPAGARRASCAPSAARCSCPTARSTASGSAPWSSPTPTSGARSTPSPIRASPPRRRRGSASCAKRARRVAVYEAALLVENGVHHGLDGLIVVACDEATQLRAAHGARRATAEADARARIAAQAPLADKLARRRPGWSTPSGPLAETKKQLATRMGGDRGEADERTSTRQQRQRQRHIRRTTSRW